MNHSYRSIRNHKTGTVVAVPENAMGKGKQCSCAERTIGDSADFGLKSLALSLMLGFGPIPLALALPVGGVVVAGSATIAGGAGNTTITQSSANAAINWQGFGIGPGEAVRFIQPDSNSVTLNRVLGPDPSSILGSLTANGKVFLVNPNGILFGSGAQVNVGGLVASTLDISDGDFMAGRYHFAGDSEASVLNQGSMDADGGYIALLGAKVGNDGILLARLGTVALAAGQAITLDVAGDGLLNVTVNQGAMHALIENGGLIRADGGQVLLTAQSAGQLLQGAVNNTGVIEARSIEHRNGKIMLLGDMQGGTVNVGGTLDASATSATSTATGAAGENGGFIETSAAHVKVQPGATVTTHAPDGSSGTWLIDPFDYVIGLGGDIEGPDLSAALVLGSVVISSNSGTTGVLGDINVNATLTWNAATTLTLNAVHDVNLNAAITASNGHLVATAGNDVVVQAGVTGITTNSGNITWTAGHDIQVNAGMASGITANSGNISWTSGRDANINSSVTTTSGNFTVCCGRDINVNAAVTTTDGNATLIAGRDIVIAAPMTMTRGNVLLRAGPDDTGLGGAFGGTVVFGVGILYTVTAPGTTITVDYTPNSYAVPTDYSGNFTGTASAALTQHMLVFPVGNDKVYDGNTTATLSFRGTPTDGGVVTLLPSAATFDDKNVATNIGITYTGYSLGGADAASFALWTDCNAVAGSGRTAADITPAAFTVQANDASKVYGTVFTPAVGAFTVPVTPVAGETVTGVTATSPTGSPATATVAGSTYPITITPGSVTGSFTPSNYVITYLDGALTVTPLAIVGSITAADKTFDATTAATISSRTLTGVVGADVVSYTGGTATFDTAVEGAGKTVTGTGLGLSGADAGNYTVNPVAITTATITAVPPVVVPPVVVPPVVVPPVVVPPVVVPPVVEPPVVVPDIPPIIIPPIVVVPIIPTPVVPPPVVQPPVVIPPVDTLAVVPEELIGGDMPVAPTPTLFNPPVWMPVVVRTETPPGLLALMPPPPPPPPPVMREVLVPALPPPPDAPPYAPPVRPLKMDRN